MIPGAIGTVVNIMIRQREPKTRIGGLCVKHEAARAMLFAPFNKTLTVETSVSETLLNVQFTLSTQIK